MTIDSHPEAKPGSHYWAENYEDADHHYYRARGVTLRITREQFHKVVNNPHLYYFSTALKLHLQIERMLAR